MDRTAKDKNLYIVLYLLLTLIICATVGALAVIGIRTADGHRDADETESETAPLPDEYSNITVVIDAGHGGEDGGTVGVNGVLEKDLNLSIALALADALNSRGINTVLTRTEDILLYDRNSNYHGQKKAQDLAERRRIAEECENAIFVSIHLNFFPEEKYSGLQVYYSENDPDSLKLAQEIQRLTAETLQPENDRQCKASKDIYLLERLTCPAVLVECGFLSNAEECKQLCSPHYQKQLAYTLSEAIIKYIDARYGSIS